jgi:hypothetical protein
MPGTVSHADWTVSWSVPKLVGGGLVVSQAYYKGRSVLFQGSAPFALVDYHGNAPIFKDGLNPWTCGGAEFTALVPTAPNRPSWLLPAGSTAIGDNQYDPITNPQGPVMVEKVPPGLIEPAKLEIWAKFQCANYQYVHRWEFLADGSIHAAVGLAGRLWTRPEHAGPDGFVGGRAHIHNFYFRLDLDVDGFANNLVQRLEHTSSAVVAGDQWVNVTQEGKQPVVDPTKYTTWRVLNKTPKPNGLVRSYELVPGSDGSPDGTYSTGDLWVVRYKFGVEDGSDIQCHDGRLETAYSTPTESVDGQDVVVWMCLRGHHVPRHRGEETDVVPYHFVGFHLQPRDFLDATPTNLYSTSPASP